jgi:AcrR family transcriptional regulator
MWLDVSMSPRRSAVNEQRRERAKSRILGAAHALFIERGYDATTLAQVSRRAGVSAGLTVYYFRTKQHLVQALADRLLHARMVRAARAAADPDEQLAAIIDAVLQTAAEEPRIIAMHLALLLQPGVAELLADGERHWEQQLPELLRDVLAARGDPGQTWLLFRATLMGAAYGVVSPYLPMPYVLTRERLFAEYGLDWDLGSPPGEERQAPAGLGGVR